MAAEDREVQHRAKFRSLLKEGGPDQLVAFIQPTPEPEPRRTLHSLARQAFRERDAGGRSFDDLVRIARAGIAEDLRQAELAQACEAFERTIEDFKEMEEDARFGLDQLRYVDRKFAPAGEVARR